MNNHIDTIKLLDYLNGSLAESERAALGEHLAGCPACRAELDSCGQIWQMLDHWQPAGRQTDLTGAIFARLDRSQTVKGGRWRFWPRASELLRTAASVAAALLIGHLAGRWSLPPAVQTMNEEAIVQALHMEILMPGAATGWGQIVLESDLANEPQG